MLSAAGCVCRCLHGVPATAEETAPTVTVHATMQAELEGLKTAAVQEKHTREAAQSKSAELEASMRRWAAVWSGGDV